MPQSAHAVSAEKFTELLTRAKATHQLTEANAKVFTDADYAAAYLRNDSEYSYWAYQANIAKLKAQIPTLIGEAKENAESQIESDEANSMGGMGMIELYSTQLKAALATISSYVPPAERAGFRAAFLDHYDLLEVPASKGHKHHYQPNPDAKAMQPGSYIPTSFAAALNKALGIGVDDDALAGIIKKAVDDKLITVDDGKYLLQANHAAAKLSTEDYYGFEGREQGMRGTLLNEEERIKRGKPAMTAEDKEGITNLADDFHAKAVADRKKRPVLSAQLDEALDHIGTLLPEKTRTKFRDAFLQHYDLTNAYVEAGEKPFYIINSQEPGSLSRDAGSFLPKAIFGKGHNGPLL